MGSVFISAALGVTTVFLAIFAWHSISRGKVYGILVGGLSIYGFLTLVQIGVLSETFSPDVIGTAALVYTIGSVLLVFSIVAFDTTFPYREADSTNLWILRMSYSGGGHRFWATVASFGALLLLLHVHSNLGAAWNVARATSGYETSMAAFLLLLGTPGIASALLSGRRFWALGLFVVNMVSFVLLGSRAAMLGALGFWAWIVYIRQPSSMKRLRLLIIFIVLGFCIQVVLRFIRGFSLDGLASALSSGDIYGLFVSNPGVAHLSGGEAAISRYFLFAVELAPSGNFGFMTSIHRLGLFFVPFSAHLLHKPMDVTYQLWGAAYSHGLFAHAEGAELLKKSFLSGDYGSLHATLFGEMFVSGQWASLILSVVLVAALCVFIDRCLNRLRDTSALLVLGPIIAGLLFVARGNSVIGFGYFIYLTIFVVIVAWFARILRIRVCLPKVKFKGSNNATHVSNADALNGERARAFAVVKHEKS